MDKQAYAAGYDSAKAGIKESQYTRPQDLTDQEFERRRRKARKIVMAVVGGMYGGLIGSAAGGSTSLMGRPRLSPGGALVGAGIGAGAGLAGAAGVNKLTDYFGYSGVRGTPITHLMHKKAYAEGYRSVMQKWAGMPTKQDLSSMSKEDGMAAIKGYMAKHPYKGKPQGLDMQKRALNPLTIAKATPGIAERLLGQMHIARTAPELSPFTKNIVAKRMSRAGKSMQGAGNRLLNNASSFAAGHGPAGARTMDIGEGLATRGLDQNSLAGMLNNTYARYK